jgi:hypothetical protein
VPAASIQGIGGRHFNTGQNNLREGRGCPMGRGTCLSSSASDCYRTPVDTNNMFHNQNCSSKLTGPVRPAIVRSQPMIV